MSDFFNRERLLRLMAEEGIDAVIATSKCNAAYLGASWGPADDHPMHLYSGGAPDKRFAIFTAERETCYSGLVDRTRWDQITRPISDFIRDRHLEDRVIAVEMDHMPAEDYTAIKNRLPNAKIVNAMRLLLETRMVKTEPEITLIRQAANIASRAHHAALSIARAGVTMGEIVSTVHDVYVRENAQSTGKFQISEFIFFHQEDRESPYQGYSGLQRDAVLKPGDHVYIDLFPMYQHYFADTARLWSAGEPRPEVLEMHRAAITIRNGILNQTRPGASTADLQRGILEAMEDAKRYEKVGIFGGHIHGVGLDVHEPPYAGGIATNQPIPPFRHYTLEPGMVFAVECFAKAQKLGGHCCMEDNVLVTKDGYELLDTVGRGLHIV